jgi:hypothetical protein
MGMIGSGMIGSRSLVIALGAACFLAVPRPASAVGLSEDDFVYLVAYDVDRNSPLIVSLSPKEQSRLHALITDTTTANNPTIRARDVADALASFKKNQLWEQEHPGQLWDTKKR